MTTSEETGFGTGYSSPSSTPSSSSGTVSSFGNNCTSDDIDMELDLLDGRLGGKLREVLAKKLEEHKRTLEIELSLKKLQDDRHEKQDDLYAKLMLDPNCPSELRSKLVEHFRRQIEELTKNRSFV
jgi:hypothetical protein